MTQRPKDKGSLDQAHADAAWASATMLGEAVWYRACAKRRTDPKSPEARAEHDALVSLVRDAAFVIERDGVEAVADWIEAEQINEVYETGAKRMRQGTVRVSSPRPVGPCPCECNSGGFCGGCGHAGCGGRR